MCLHWRWYNVSGTLLWSHIRYNCHTFIKYWLDIVTNNFIMFGLSRIFCPYFSARLYTPEKCLLLNQHENKSPIYWMNAMSAMVAMYTLRLLSFSALDKNAINDTNIHTHTESERRWHNNRAQIIIIKKEEVLLLLLNLQWHTHKWRRSHRKTHKNWTIFPVIYTENMAYFLLNVTYFPYSSQSLVLFFVTHSDKNIHTVKNMHKKCTSIQSIYELFKSLIIRTIERMNDEFTF